LGNIVVRARCRCGEHRGIEVGAADARLPLLVLAADGTNDGVPADQVDVRKAGDAGYASERRRIARQSTRGCVTAIAHSSHNVPEEQPAATAQVIATVSAQVMRTAAP